MPNFLLFFSEGKIVKNSHFIHFEALSLDYQFFRKVIKTNFEFGTTFIYDFFQYMPLKCKMPKNEKSKKSNFEPPRGTF